MWYMVSFKKEEEENMGTCGQFNEGSGTVGIHVRKNFSHPQDQYNKGV